MEGVLLRVQGRAPPLLAALTAPQQGRAAPCRMRRRALQRAAPCRPPACLQGALEASKAALEAPMPTVYLSNLPAGATPPPNSERLGGPGYSGAAIEQARFSRQQQQGGQGTAGGSSRLPRQRHAASRRQRVVPSCPSAHLRF